MKMKNKLFFIVIIVLFTFSSCSGIIKSYVRKDAENVPVDIGKEKTIMLVVEKNKSYNKEVEKIFKECYSGDYLFITKEELDTKYSDTVKYRYAIGDQVLILRPSKVTITHTTDLNTGFTRSESDNNTSASRSFQIIDRITKKVYDTGISSGTSWKTILKAYLKKIDSERKKNGGN